MSNTLHVQIVKTEKLGSGEVWYGFNIFDQYSEAFSYQSETEEKFKESFPTTSAVLKAVSNLNPFEGFDEDEIAKTHIDFDAPGWMIHDHPTPS